jgi:hypothetical protein
VLLWEKREKYENSPIVVYFSLAKASDRIRVATGTVDEVIRTTVIGNKRRTNVTQPKKLRLKPSIRNLVVSKKLGSKRFADFTDFAS